MKSSTEHVGRGLWTAALIAAVACGGTDASTPKAECEDPPAVDAAEALELYLEGWSEAAPTERACMFQRSLAPDVVLIATATPIPGRSAVVQELDERTTQLFGDSAMRDLAGSVESRHHEARLPWTVADASGAVVERGEDWLEFNDDGLLSRVHILAGTGADAPLSDALLAWQRAWNARDEADRADALSDAATENVGFTDIVTEVHGREALGIEIGRQQNAINATLRLDERVEVFAGGGDQPILLRLSAQLRMPQGGAIHVVDYVRLRDGRIEQLSGFPSPAP